MSPPQDERRALCARRSRLILRLRSIMGSAISITLSSVTLPFLEAAQRRRAERDPTS